jgi:hypothetical protein
MEPMKYPMKRRILSRSHRSLAVAVLTALLAANVAEAAYWNRGRNRRGSSDDAGGVSSSGGQSSENRRGRDLDRDGIPNLVDPDVDNDGVANGDDRNVDGGVAASGSKTGKYIGDRLPNDHPGERDIDDDGLADDSQAELDIDGDGLADDRAEELDIDGDGRADDAADESDLDGDGRADDAANEFDIDGDGLTNGSDDDADGDGSANADDSDDDADGGLDDVDSTSQGAVSGTTPPAVGGGQVGDGLAPASLDGLVYVIRQKNGVIEANLNFTSLTAGNETDPDGDNDSYTYTYTPAGAAASLRLQFKTDKWDEYDLNYATGGYVRREFDKNALKDTDTGFFSLNGVTPPPPPPPAPGGTLGGVVGDGTAPATLAGVTWVVRQQNGKVEASLLFATATGGSENDPDGDIDAFTYDYAPNGGTATLRLTFKPGKWDEYDLNFATGFYTRREFKNSALDDTDTGFFNAGAAVVTPPAGGGSPPPAGGDDDGTPDQGSGDK